MERIIVKSENKTNSSDKYALFIGRWQPFHTGHQWLIDQQLNKGIKVCVAIRDVPLDDDNWWTSNEIQDMLEERFSEDISKGLIKIIQIPNIDSINIGRGVGYDIIEHIPPSEIEQISGTKIRESMKKKDDE